MGGLGVTGGGGGAGAGERGREREREREMIGNKICDFERAHLESAHVVR